MLKRYIQFISVVLPILILLAIGGYFTYTSWFKYKNNMLLQTELHHAKLLQSLENSALNEVVCIATMSEHKKLMQKVCNRTKETTDNLLKEILTQKDDTSLYQIENIIKDVRTKIKDSGTIAVEKLVNGDLDKKLHTFIQSYIHKVNTNKDSLDKKEYLRLYSDISDISYSTEAEKALVSYYLSLNKKVPAKNLIYWDKIINASQVPELNKEKISVLYEDIESQFNNDNFQKSLRQIEDVRLDIMSNSNTGNYVSNVADWVAQLNNKQKTLHNVQHMLLDNILHTASKDLNKSKVTLFLALASLLLGIIGLLFFMSLWRKNNTKRKLLDELVGKISQVNSDDKLVVSDDITSHKVAYNYIASNYESLHDSENRKDLENKTNSLFMNNLTYEIKTPLNGISGYTKLLKETPLNIEQSGFVTMIENNFENLDSIVNKISNTNTTITEKLELENILFDLVQKVESSVETFSIKADQKDIVLGLYIDPDLIDKVKGDATKLSHIITNLIDNALELSNAYDTINVIVEKIREDNRTITVKFQINDQGIGYTEEEIKQIQKILETMKSNDNVLPIDMKNLSISSKIIKRMGGILELESIKGEGSTFSFALTFEKDDKENASKAYPTFEDMTVGLALPSKDINRQVDQNLAKYIKYLKANFKIYDYDELFDKHSNIEFPELLFVYHNYARLEGELDAFSKLPSKIALLTSGTLRSRIDIQKHTFSSVVYAPITMSKVVKIFGESKLDKPVHIEKKIVIDNIENTNKKIVSEFNDMSALVVEENKISQQILTSQLSNLGINVISCTSGKEAFSLRKEKEFNIIFMTLDMPIMDGFDTTSKILYFEGVSQLEHIPIVGLTNDINDELLEKCIKVGMDDCIEKDINSKDMSNILKKYCIEFPLKVAQTEEEALIAKVLAGDFLKE